MSTLDFKPANNVPIIGQPFTVKGGFPTTLLQCQCEAHEPVMLIGGAPGACPACHRMFVCAACSFNASTSRYKSRSGSCRNE